VNYPQLIQFKRLEERAFIFLNGRQFMLGFFGIFAGLSLASRLNLHGWPVWVAVVVAGALGVATGARYRGLYGYQYLGLLARSLARFGQTARPSELYDRSPDEDLSYVLGAPDGGALVLRQAPASGPRARPKAGGPAVYRLRPVDLAQHPPQTVGLLLQRWAGFWAGASASAFAAAASAQPGSLAPKHAPTAPKRAASDPMIVKISLRIPRA